MTNTCPLYEWSRLGWLAPISNKRTCLLEQIIMMVAGPDNQSTCEEKFVSILADHMPGSVGARVRPVSITTTGGFY